MGQWIALVRGINVGGRKTIAMSALRDVLADLGFCDVQSLLQSGNLLFCADHSAAELERLLTKEASSQLGIDADFLLRSGKQWTTIIAGNPFPDAARLDPSHLAVMCLQQKPTPTNVSRLEKTIPGRE